MRESWFTNFASARTVGDIANFSSDDDICANIHPSQSTTVVDSPGARSLCDVDDDDLQKTNRITREDSCDAPGRETSNCKGEEDSFYSMDSAEQDAHPFLLSMPIIPQIKLERKATVRKPDSGPLSDTTQNQSLLSPRIRDLRTPARMSSRRYGRILARISPQVVVSDTAESDRHDALTFQASRRFGSTSWSDAENSTELTCTHSASEPMLNPPYTSDDEKEPLVKKGIDESLHSDVLLSMIEEVGSFPEQYCNSPDSGVDVPRGPKQVPPKHLQRSHQRSSVHHSISFSSIAQAVADGCASLDLLLRKPKTKPKSMTKHFPNAHDPTSKWAPKQGQIIIKVFVPSTDDIWMFRVPQDINLADFTSRVVTKLGFAVSFSGSLWDEPKYYFMTDGRFKSWVNGRIRFGRNLPIVAHVLPPLPLVRLSVDGDGCEVWCYA
ncbi:hypothetical protein J3R82DRAFT_3761 [Butyriboletus roseoflavus]|nr:hypothetical protein J3R82DRAFT_3761 [Butyriboletus roseoflavus]